MAPKSSDVAKSIGLEAMDCAEVMLKACLKFSGPKAIELCKSFPQKTEELGVGFLLTAAFHNHAWKLGFLPGGQSDFHQLVARFFEINRAHYCQVYCPAEVD